MSIGVSVPATSANLGPGFDSFGIALKLYNRFEGALADAWEVSIEGEGRDYLRRDGRNKVADSMGAVFEAAGRPELRAHVRCINKVPTGNGLGSSSTAIVGGVLLARELLVEAGEERMTDEQVFAHAVALEGHADNVAPALFGGFTVCWQDDVSTNAQADSAANWRWARFEPRCGLAAVVVPSLKELSTRRSRTLLPDEVSHADAAFNVGHAGLLAASIVSGDVAHLSAALDDRLHQPYREGAVDDLARLRVLLEEAGCEGVALSGAGPSVIGLVTADDDEQAYDRAAHAAAKAADAVSQLENRREPLPLGFAREGARIYRA